MKNLRFGWLGVCFVLLSSCAQFPNAAQVSEKILDLRGSETAITSKAYNALEIWKTGVDSPLYQLPEIYGIYAGAAKSDHIFFEASGAFFKNVNGKLTSIATGTAGVRFDPSGKRLVYPERAGRNLELSFSERASKNFTQLEASAYCQSIGERLPTVYELFDFCTVGFAVDADGQFPENRCGGLRLWSATVHSEGRQYAWLFEGSKSGRIDLDYRFQTHSLMCIGE